MCVARGSCEIRVQTDANRRSFNTQLQYQDVCAFVAKLEYEQYKFATTGMFQLQKAAIVTNSRP